MAKTKIEFEVEIPEGYEGTGECRKVLRGEWHLSNEGIPEIWDVTAQSCSRYPILRKAEVWKQLTPGKALEFMLSKLPVTMRHKTWGIGGRTHRQSIEKMYRVWTTSDELSIDMPDQALISNVEYLEEV